MSHDAKFRVLFISSDNNARTYFLAFMIVRTPSTYSKNNQRIVIAVNNY